MFRSWKLGTAFGIGVYVHWTFLLLPGWVFLTNLGRGELELAVFSAAILFAVFGCVVLHELGHALMARRFGIATRDITLYPIGGVARLERMSERPWEEFWIAIAGPAVNVAIAGVLAALMAVTGAYPTPDHFMADGLVESFVPALLVSNVMLVGFNLLPLFPSDGGRVLRALLALRLGQLRATEIAAGVGAGMAILLGVVGFLKMWPMLMLVAVFLYFAGQQELWSVRSRAAARHAPVLDALPADEVIDVAAPVRPFFTGFTWDGRARLWIEWRNGRPVQTIPADY